MISPIQEAALVACRRFMLPVARFLLRNGVGYREFAEISKLAFVQVASDEYGLRGRPTNMSRVAAMTGLTRKDVRKVREQLEEGELITRGQMKRPELVLEAWFRDRDFSDRRGRPKRLSYSGKSSFVDLVKRVGGDIPPNAMLKELLRAGSVQRVGTKLRAVSPSFVPEPDDPDALVVAGDALKHLVSTLDHNFRCRRASDRYLERRVFSEKLTAGYVDQFRALARAKAQALLEELDEWLNETERTAPPQSPGTDVRTVGLGVYFFEDEHKDPLEA
jgi:hypothetical protein